MRKARKRRASSALSSRGRYLEYSSLSSKRRKQIYIEIKNQIRRAAPHLGGLFYTHDYLHGKNGWIDCYFLGKNRTVYNVTLETARHCYSEVVRDQARDNAENRVPSPELTFAPRDPVTGCRQIIFPEETPNDAFDGLSRWDWRLAQERLICEARSVSVFEKVTLHRDYAYGVGLHATIDVPTLTVATVNEFIVSFLKHETAYTNPQPLSFGYDEIFWGLDANAIVDPCENPPHENAETD